MTKKKLHIRTWLKSPTLRALLFWLLPGGFLAYFFYQPLLAIFNLLISPEWGFSLTDLKWDQLWDPLWFTIVQASLSTLLTLIIGIPGAWLFSHFTFPGKKLLNLLTTLPFILPTVVVAAGFNALLGPRGWINLGLMAIFNLDSAPIQFLNTFAAILTAHVFYNTTILIRVVSSAWSRQNIRLQHAAQALGANPWRAFWEVTLPLLRPSILGGTLLVFLFNFTSFGAVLMLGGSQFSTLEVEIYIQALHLLNLPLAAVLSTLQLICTLIITVGHNRISRRSSMEIAPKTRGITPRRPRKGWERLVTIVLIATLFLLLVSPLASLALRSFVKLEADRGERGEIQRGLTLQYYRRAVGQPPGVALLRPRPSPQLKTRLCSP